MIIKEISPGPKAPCGSEGALIFVGEGDNLVIINAEERQSGKQEVIDIYQDELGNLVEGKEMWYAATVVIPPRRYRLSDTGEVNDQGQSIIEREALPLDMEAVTVTLWPLNKPLNPENQGGEEQ